MRVTKIQVFTVLSIIGFLIYEIWYIPEWLKTLEKGDPPIRLDIIIFLPIVVLLIMLSVIQLIRKK